VAAHATFGFLLNFFVTLGLGSDRQSRLFGKLGGNVIEFFGGRMSSTQLFGLAAGESKQADGRKQKAAGQPQTQK
jgi:hypothetical protein